MVRIAVVLCLFGLSPLSAQDAPTLGLNFRVVGIPQIGVTWLVSPRVTLRPAFQFTWSEASGALGTSESTQYGFDLDVFIRTATWDRVTSYAGVGGGFGYVNQGDSDDPSFWIVRTLIGARIRLFERVSVFGEAGLAYQELDVGVEQKTFGSTTMPLGVIIFLK